MSVRRLFAPAVGAAALLGALVPLAAAPTYASSTDCNGSLQVTLDNPNPGDILPIGKYTVQGAAFDAAATSGSGVDSVNVYLDNRDLGGTPLATATLGQAGPGGFVATVDLTPFSGPHTIEVRAHSSATGKEAVVWAPVNIGDTNGGGSPTSEPPLGGCAAQNQPATAAGSAPARATTAPQPAAQSQVVLEPGNPHAGDVLPTSPYVVQGVAFDRAATAGNGIDSVTVYLGARDNGGVPLAQATFTGDQYAATIDLSNHTGNQTLEIRARSSVSGKEAVQDIPVVVGTQS
jgi:hypothetical protein